MNHSNSLRTRVSHAVSNTPIIDIHTHLYPPGFNSLLLRGIDDLLTYHYLIAETFRWLPATISPEDFYSWETEKQADLVWKTLFTDHSPVSEPTRGVLTCLNKYDLTPDPNALDDYRNFFSTLSADDHVNVAMKCANVKTLVLTNDPFDDEERGYWEKNTPVDNRFRTALRIDLLFADWPAAVQKLSAQGFTVQETLDENTSKEITRFLSHWFDTMKPVYLMASLPPDFTLPSASVEAQIFEKIVLPFCREKNTPFASMIGCKRQINPALQLAGDGVTAIDTATIEYMAREYPDNKFLVTLLSRENQHSLTIIARKFRNLMPFGCWWFLNSPEFVNEMTRMRLEWLGTSVIPQHSDARVLDQIIYKWNHSTLQFVDILTEKYADIEATGWRVSDDDIQRDVSNLLADNFTRFTESH